MITRRATICGILVALASNVRAATPAFRPLQTGSFADLVTARRNQPFLLILVYHLRALRDEFALLARCAPATCTCRWS